MLYITCYWGEDPSKVSLFVGVSQLPYDGIIHGFLGLLWKKSEEEVATYFDLLIESH